MCHDPSIPHSPFLVIMTAKVKSSPLSWLNKFVWKHHSERGGRGLQRKLYWLHRDSLPELGMALSFNNVRCKKNYPEHLPWDQQLVSTMNQVSDDIGTHHVHIFLWMKWLGLEESKEYLVSTATRTWLQSVIASHEQWCSGTSRLVSPLWNNCTCDHSASLQKCFYI